MLRERPTGIDGWKTDDDHPIFIASPVIEPEVVTDNTVLQPEPEEKLIKKVIGFIEGVVNGITKDLTNAKHKRHRSMRRSLDKGAIYKRVVKDHRDEMGRDDVERTNIFERAWERAVAFIDGLVRSLGETADRPRRRARRAKAPMVRQRFRRR